MESREPPLGVPITNDPDLWFDDGSIVVVAESTGFRVHKTLLARLSPVFRDVFGIPQPAAGAGSIQDTPVVHVSDSAYDMRCILHAIYDSRTYLRDTGSETPFSVLSALMRLGHKYELTDILDEAAEQLGDYFTCNFNGWLENHAGGEDMPQCFNFSPDKKGDLFEAVNLIRLTGKTALLPAALYKCAQLDVADLLAGCERQNSDREGGGREQLSPADVQTCLLARERLLLQSSRNILTTFSKPDTAADCRSRDACAQHLAVFAQGVAANFPRLLITDALAVFRVCLGPMDSLAGLVSLCRECVHSLDAQYKVALRETWEKLPSILGLEDEPLEGVWVDCRKPWHVGLR